MADLAKLGILVDSSQAATATGRLNALSASAGRAQGATTGLTASSKRLALSLGAAGLAGAATALGAAFVQSTRKGKQFTSQLSELEAITGITGDALEELSENALDTSAETGRAATEIVEAYKLVASQLAEIIDFETEAGQEVLRGVAEDAVTLSQAAGIELKQAVEATTTSINQFNLSAEASTDVINNLAAGSKYGAAEVANIQAAMQEAGSAAAAANEDITTTNAAIQVLAANAIKGSKAGTGLRNVFLRLMTESDKLAEMGLGNVNLKADGLLKTLEKLNPIANDSAALTKIFGQEAFNAASLLIRNRDALASLESKLGDTNTATEQAAIQMDNLDGDIARLAKTVNKDLIESFQNGESSFREFVQGLQDIWEEFGDDFMATTDFFVNQSINLIKRWGDIFRDEVTNMSINPAEVGLGQAFSNTLKWIDRGLFKELPERFHNLFIQPAAEDIEWISRYIQRTFGDTAVFPEDMGTQFQAELMDQMARVEPVNPGEVIDINHGALITEIEASIEAAKREAERNFEDEPILLNAEITSGRGTLADDELLSQVRNEMQQIDRLGQIFDDFDVGTAKASILRSEIERLVKSGGDHTATISRLRTMYEQWTDSSIQGVSGLNSGMNDTQENTLRLNDAARDLGFTFSSAFEDAIVQGNALSDVLQGLLQDIQRIILRTTVTEPLGNGLSDWIGGLFTSSSSATTASGSILDGSVTGGGTNVTDALITSRGDVIRGDPNDNWLAFQGDPDRLGGGGSEVNVIIENYSGEEVQTERRKKPGGEMDLKVMIGNTVKDLHNEGALDGAMSRNYGINRQGY